MNFLLQHIDHLVDTYSGEIPLSIFLKDYLRQHPKLGSRDRRAIHEAMYLYYRYADRLPETLSTFEVIFNGLRLSGNSSSFLESTLLRHDSSFPDRLTNVQKSDLSALPQLSEGIEPKEWLDSLLIQPDLFIRMRQADEVMERLAAADISFTRGENENANCLAIPNGTKLEQLLSDASYVVQDWASQKSVQLLLASRNGAPARTVWDTCAGAGGKSLMLKDHLPDVKILASDIRNSILINLLERFQRYRLQSPETLVIDITETEKTRKTIARRRFDLVLCDVPCTGSGTWARTPEQPYFFDAESLDPMAKRQFDIASTAANYLADGGILAYITCSVFQLENEGVVNLLLESQSLNLVSSTLINGIENKADSMYVAIFQKKNS
jgi:16S rRNA (cytosine967-C5)-methyltransferase